MLGSTNLQPDVMSQIEHSLEDVLMAKNKTVLQLQHELQNLKHVRRRTLSLSAVRCANAALRWIV